MATAETTVFVSHKTEKKRWNSTKVNSSKYTKRWADRAKQKFPSNKWKQLGYWPAESPKNSSIQGIQLVNRVQRRMQMRS